jgi:hypothetical protein
MGGMTLSPDEVHALAAYVWTLGHSSGAARAAR